MLFVTPEFLFVFLPVVLVITAFSLRFWGKSAAIAVLTVASLFFYGWWKLSGLAIILVSVGVNYTIARQIADEKDIRSRKVALGLGVALNLLALCYFKYRNFFIDNVLEMFGETSGMAHIVPPLAISFYTFQQIAFLVDTYHGKMRRILFSNYLISVVFFPHLIAGPLLHYRDIIQQFEERFRISWATLACGMPVFVMGMAKKLAIADPLSQVVNPLFTKAESQPLELFEAWAASLGYTAQLYFDFSGYSDMAIGLALMFGIVLPINFFSPYKSTSIIEFWRRWHITLSNFLRDYLYIPLGGGRAGAFRRYVNLMIVMLLGGLWHGASWTFVLWGGLHGAMLVVNHLWRATISPRLLVLNSIALPFYGVLTFLLVVVGWVLFRAESFAGATNVLGGMFYPQAISLPWGVAFALGIDPAHWIFGDKGLSFPDLSVFLAFGSAAYLLVWFCPNTTEIFRLTRDPLNLATRRSIGGSIGIGALFWLSLFGLFSAIPSEFLYFRF